MYKKEWLNRNIKNTYDMMQGAMNRICVTKDDDEREGLAESIDFYKIKLVELAKCRAHNYEDIDAIYEKFSVK